MKGLRNFVAFQTPDSKPDRPLYRIPIDRREPSAPFVLKRLWSADEEPFHDP